MTTTTMSLLGGISPLVLFIAKATLVLLAAVCGALALRSGTAGARHLVWLAALVGVLALPVLARIPALRLNVLPAPLDTRWTLADTRTPPESSIESSHSALRVTAQSPNRPIGESSNRPIAQSPNRPIVQSPTTTLLVAWAAVALSLLAWLVAGAMQVRRIVNGGRELTSPDWTTPLREVADRLDLDVPPRLVISDEIEMAFACRAMTPTIVLPKAAESWTDDRRRAVLFHELAHVKRHDLLGHTLGRVACALYWFHPLVWTAAKKLRAESERACDDLVLSCGAKPSDYAQHLLDMVTSVRRFGAPIMAMPMARKKEFEGRMLAILDPAIRRAAPGRAQSAAVIATIGALSLTIAAVAPAAAKERVPAAQAPTSPQSTIAQVDSTAKAKAPPAAEPAPPVDVRRAENFEQVEQVEQVSQSKRTDVSTTIGKFASEISTATVNALASALTGRSRTADTARANVLIKVLETDPDAAVRRSAAWGLHDTPVPGARRALVQALTHDADDAVREMSAWALAGFESDEAVNALASAMHNDKSARVRTTSAWAVGTFEGSGGVDALMSAASDPDANVRESAIWAFGVHQVRRAPATVINALGDPEARIRTVAAWALGQTMDTAAMHPLERAFETENDNHVRTAELWALTNIGDAPVSVVDAAMKSSDPEMRRHAVGLLAGSIRVWPWPWPRPQPRVMP